MADGKVFTGSRGVLVFDGVILADLVNCNWDANIQMEPIDVCGEFLTLEHVEVGKTASLSCQTVKRRGTDVASKTDKNGTTWSPHDVVTAIAREEMTAYIRDTTDNSIVHIFTGVKYAGQSSGISARAVTYDNLQFVVRDHREESEVSGA